MHRHILKLVLISSLISYSALSSADDGEIFFNKELTAAKPNVIFLLDVSGSMAWDPYADIQKNPEGHESRLDILKNSLFEILSDKSITDIRAGITSFSSNPTQIHDVVDIDTVNTDMAIDVQKGTSQTVLTQPVLYTTDNGFQINSARPVRPDLGYSSVQAYNSYVVAYRFENILLKNTNSSSAKIANATLRLRTDNVVRNADIFIDVADTAPYLTNSWDFLSIRKQKNSTLATKCVSNQVTNTYFTCDVTDAVNKKIAQVGWKNGNAITFYVVPTNSNGTVRTMLYFFGAGAYYVPKLVITADNNLIAENEKTYRDILISKTYGLVAKGGTETLKALFNVAQYVSNVPPSSSATGPFHGNTLSSTSPLLEGCQLTHIILMTDGVPDGERYASTATNYMGQGTNANNCKVITGIDGNGKDITKNDSDFRPTTTNYSNEQCGRAFVSWMARRDQSGTVFVGANYIKTHTIGFALRNQDGSQSGYEQSGQNYINDLATYGMGKSYEAVDNESLTAAFKEIISDVRAADSPSASGRVTLSPQSRYKQRKEVYYSLYASAGFNYWAGNMKRFQLKYIDTILTDGSTGQRSILVDKNSNPAMDQYGAIFNDASSFWTNSKKDGGKVSFGGVVGMLPDDPDERNLFTIKDPNTGSHTQLNANADLTNTDLALTGNNQDKIRKGLLDFIRGYTFYEDGSTTIAPKKIGDAARSAVTLLTYGCNDADNEIGVLECSSLNQVALLASNDGFIRGYDVNTGKAIYEFMPKEMLPLIQQLQAKTVVSFLKSRFYGLDSNIVIYHDDQNNDGYVNNNEKAYAYIAAGRGGPYLYAVDLSNRNNIKLKWQINDQMPGFDKLGYTWSTPVVGKIKRGAEIIPVLIFGGGYDKSPTDTDMTAREKSNKGNALYIVNAITGNLIWSTSKNMDYSIPSPVSVVTDNSPDNLITDIFFGDMGGQLWRFYVDNNASDDNSLVRPVGSGIIASLASDSNQDSRKFYQAPSIYAFKENDIEMLSVNIGSGFRNHPLATETQDKIYSFRFPKNPSSSSTQSVLTENDLAVASADGQSLQNQDKLSNGFMIKLSAEGEKVISDGFADFDRLVFNTYIPTKTDKKTCVPSVGTQRTYNYSIKTGISLLETPYISNSVSSLPPDVTSYCNDNYCTIVSDPSQLSPDKELPKGKDGKDPFVVKTSVGGSYIKTGWTNIFNITTK